MNTFEETIKDMRLEIRDMPKKKQEHINDAFDVALSIFKKYGHNKKEILNVLLETAKKGGPYSDAVHICKYIKERLDL